MDELLYSILSLFDNDVICAGVGVFVLGATVVLLSNWWRNRTHGGGW